MSEDTENEKVEEQSEEQPATGVDENPSEFDEAAEEILTC